jgi:hypothetical protein
MDKCKKYLIVLFTFILLFSTTNQSKVSAAGFTDVPYSHGFYKEIMYLLEKGVISRSTKLGVNQKVTREEVAVMVSKAVGLDGTKTSTKFKDIPSTMTSSGYINSAVKAGIIQGYSDGTFRPKEIVNRGQMAIFLARAFNLTVESKAVYKDMSPSMASYSAVKKIVAAQITTGYSNKTFKPNDSLTKGQISAFIARAMGYNVERGGLAPRDELGTLFPIRTSLDELTSYYGDPTYDDYYMGGRLVMFNDEDGYFLDDIGMVTGFMVTNEDVNVFGTHVGMIPSKISSIFSEPSESYFDEHETQTYVNAYYKDNYKIFYSSEKENGVTTSVMILSY